MYRAKKGKRTNLSFLSLCVCVSWCCHRYTSTPAATSQWCEHLLVTYHRERHSQECPLYRIHTYIVVHTYLYSTSSRYYYSLYIHAYMVFSNNNLQSIYTLSYKLTYTYIQTHIHTCILYTFIHAYIAKNTYKHLYIST